MLLNCGVGEDSWESLGLQGDPTSPSYRKSVLGVHWKDWRWSWNSSTLATSCEELTHWKRLWCWERLRAGGEGDDRGWDGWMASLIRWTWILVNSGSWWWTGRPGVLRFMGSQRVGYDWATELNWTEENKRNKKIQKPCRTTTTTTIKTANKHRTIPKASGQGGESKEPWIIIFDFVLSVNTLIAAFKVSTWCPWTWSWKQMKTHGSQ